MNGHKVQVVVMPYFPFTDYERRGDPGITPVTPRDSLDVRILNTLAAHFNFTYEMREPADRQWGLLGKEGNWTGIVGELQHHRADHSTLLIPNYVRSRIIQFCKLYSRDPMVIVSLKPQPHPRHLSIIRPFPGLVWQILLLSLVCWSVAFWVMQKVWTWLLGGSGLKLGSSLYFSWSVLLENARDNMPHNLMARVLVGWWLVVCLVVSSAYRSSLISHLTVQEYSRPINSFQDLLKRPGWTWGAMEDMRTSIYRNFFMESGPLMRYIYDRFEVSV
ncbi:glutamate receptor ionotropic, kainate 2-like [Cherax quadricarinatus]|uniref:glutamate receptor ionotropic, kainate 2-like n=1 Tax=Cherax quadricarinatus TaxID=27406 RepID=UPI00387E94EE